MESKTNVPDVLCLYANRKETFLTSNFCRVFRHFLAEPTGLEPCRNFVASLAASMWTSTKRWPLQWKMARLMSSSMNQAKSNQPLHGKWDVGWNFGQKVSILLNNYRNCELLIVSLHGCPWCFSGFQWLVKQVRCRCTGANQLHVFQGRISVRWLQRFIWWCCCKCNHWFMDKDFQTYPVIETYNLSMIQLHFWKI